MDTMRTPMREPGPPDAAPTEPDQRAIMVRFFREAGVIGLGAFLYFFVRGLMETREALAISHAESLIDLEQRLGLFREPDVQGFILRWDWLVTLANRVYIFGHWPVIVTTLVWLLWKHRDAFGVYRSALLISGAIGLVCFVLLPTAPPRLLVDHGFVDTVTLNSNAYRVLQPPAFTNQFAAMPSLHVGWNLLVGIAIFRHATWRPARVFGVVMPLVMYLATIATANHYFLDGIMGSLVALIGLAIAWQISRMRSTPSETAPVQAMRGQVLGQGWSHDAAA